MSGIAKKLMAAASQAGSLDIADAFSTDLYTGTGSNFTLTNGIDLAGEGGLVWVKMRSGGGPQAEHVLIDTERGSNKRLLSDQAGSEETDARWVTGFNSDGFGIGDLPEVNNSGSTYVAWTFRQAPKFFDVVTYTGDGVAGRTIPHNLGIEPGMLVVKRRDSTGGWPVYHRSSTAAPETDYLLLNTLAATADLNTYWNDTAPTSTQFTVGTNADVNASGGTYVAYLFAHDTAADGVIQCGSYTGNGSATGPVINLGWEPQWLLVKSSTRTFAWFVWDNARSTTNPRQKALLPNDSGPERDNSAYRVDFNSTGFQLKSNGNETNENGEDFIYVAIRKEEV